MPASAESRDQVLARIEKLLRLASPNSKAPEAERSNAALEIVRLIVEYDLRLILPKSEETLAGWRACKAARDDRCAFCLGQIAIGEKILGKSMLFGTQYAHVDCASP